MKILKRLFTLLKPYWLTLIVSGLLLIARTGLMLAPPIFQKIIIDDIITARDLSRLGAIIGILIGVYVVQQLASAGDMYVRHALGQKIIYDLRVHLYSYLQHLSLSFFERTSTGELMSRVTNDVNALENFTTHGAALTAVDLMRLIGGLIILISFDPRLALLTFLPVPILAVSLRFFNKHILTCQ